MKLWHINFDLIGVLESQKYFLKGVIINLVCPMVCHSEHSPRRQLHKNLPLNRSYSSILRVISGEYFESEFKVLLKGSETLVEIRSSGIVDKRAGTPAEIRLSGIADERADTSAEIRSSGIDERADTPAEIRSSGSADEGANTPPKIGSSKIVFPDRGADTIRW